MKLAFSLCCLIYQAEMADGKLHLEPSANRIGNSQVWRCCLCFSAVSSHFLMGAMPSKYAVVPYVLL